MSRFYNFRVFLGAVIVFCHSRHYLGQSLARGFRTSLFLNLYGTYLDFVSIVVSSRWLEKIRHAKHYREKLI